MSSMFVLFLKVIAYMVMTIMTTLSAVSHMIYGAVAADQTSRMASYYCEPDSYFNLWGTYIPIYPDSCGKVNNYP